MVVAVVTLLTFLPSVRGSFVNLDDGNNVYQNPFLNPVVNGASIARFWQESYNELYTPITYTLWAGCAIVGRLARPATSVEAPGLPSPVTLTAWPFHAVGVLFHVANALLVYALLHSLLSLRRKPNDTAPSVNGWAACIGALFWAIHPLQVEPVAWVTGNNNVFSGFFALLTLLLYVRWAGNGRGAGDDSDSASRRNTLFIAATAAFVLALLAKPTAAVTPLLAAAIEAGVLRRPVRTWALPLGIWLAAAGVLLLVTRETSGGSEVPDIPLYLRPLVAGDALAFYTGKVILPLRLCPDYGRLPLQMGAAGLAPLAVLAYLVLAVAAVVIRRFRQTEGAGWAGACITLFILGVLPVLGFVPFYYQVFSTVADRYMYLSLLGPSLALAYVLALGVERANANTAKRFPVPFLIAGAAVATLIAGTSFQVPLWRNLYTLFEHVARINPRSATAYTNIGVGYLSDKRPADALPYLARALTLTPGRATPLYNYSIALGDTGRTAEAIAALEAAIRMEPLYADAYSRLGITLSRDGHNEEAARFISEAARLNPAYFKPLRDFAMSLVAKPNPVDGDAATIALRGVLTVAPQDAEAQAALTRLEKGKTSP